MKDSEKQALTELLDWCEKYQARIRVYENSKNACITFNETEYVFTGIFEKGYHDITLLGSYRPVVLARDRFSWGGEI